MSSTGQAVGGIVGAVVGFIVPGVGPLMSADSAIGVGCIVQTPKRKDGDERGQPECEDRNEK